jgi:hypothetical protein
MTPPDLLLAVLCLGDDELQALDPGRLRQRGPKPTLADREVITMELVGEFWKLGTDQDLFGHVRRYHTAEFPALATLDRTACARQAANRWRVKQLIQERLAEQLRGDDPVWLVDSLPRDACPFARAPCCQRFARAGHPYPLHVPRAGDVSLWRLEGLLLGVTEARFPEQTRQLAVGDKLLVYSDGIDTATFEDKPPGADSLLACAERHRALPVQAFVERLARELFREAEQPDDLTLFGLEVCG